MLIGANLRAVPDRLDGFLHASKIAHPVVNDHDHADVYASILDRPLDRTIRRAGPQSMARSQLARG
jgi:hypothetical protein